MKTRFILSMLICFFPGYLIYAQTEKTSNQTLINEYAVKYIEAAGDYAAIFDGKDQPKLINNIKSGYLRPKGYKDIDSWGYEFFNIDSETNGTFGEGTLLYDGIIYPKVSMRLDLYTDELMLLTPNITYRIVLDPEKVGYADFNGYRVKYTQPDSKAKIKKGYYVYLYSGKYIALKKETLGLNNNRSALTEWSRKYYIYKDGVYHAVKNKKSVLNVFKTHKKELDQYIKDTRIDFKDMELALPLIIYQFEKLSGL